MSTHAGKTLDPACGSGGMFVQSAKFRKRHRKDAINRVPSGGDEDKGQEDIPTRGSNTVLFIDAV